MLIIAWWILHAVSNYLPSVHFWTNSKSTKRHRQNWKYLPCWHAFAILKFVFINTFVSYLIRFNEVWGRNILHAAHSFHHRHWLRDKREHNWEESQFLPAALIFSARVSCAQLRWLDPDSSRIASRFLFYKDYLKHFLSMGNPIPTLSLLKNFNMNC